MTRRGWFRISLLAWVSLWGGGCSRPPEPGTLASLKAQAKRTGVKVLLIGIDGASFRVMDPLLEAGKLPEFSRLIKEGVRGPLESIEPMFSPAIWTSMITGKSRQEHGIEYFVTHPSDEPIDWGKKPDNARLVSALDRRCLALWNITTAFEVGNGIIGWWATWPAEAVNGVLVSDRVTHDRYSEWVGGNHREFRAYPTSLMNQLEPLLVDPARPPMDEIDALVRLTPEEKTEFTKVTKPIFGHGLSVFKYAHCSQRSYENIAMRLLETQDQPDFMAVFLVANDPICHTFWHFYQPQEFDNVDSEKAKRLGRLIPNYYRHNDRYLKRLLARVDDDTVVIIVSDHGFQPSGSVPKLESADNLPNLRRSAYGKGQVAVGQSGMHHIEGVFIACGGPVKKGVRVEAKVYDVAPTILALLGLPVPKDMPGRVLTEIVDEPFWTKYPVQYINSYEPLIEREDLTDVIYTPDPELMARLKALGYVASDGEPQPGGDAK